MADKVTESSELKIENLFDDGDTRTITLKNPISGITTSQIQNLEQVILNGNAANSLLIGDKYGSDFKRIQEVKTVNKNIVEYDIS